MRHMTPEADTHTKKPPRRQLERRATPQTQIDEIMTMCEDHADSINDIKEILLGMKEPLDAWNNARGTYKTLRYISLFIRAVALTAAALAALWFFLKQGKWPL